MADTFLGITNAVNVPAAHEITGHKSVREALRNTEKYSSDLQGDADVRDYRQIPLEVDPPRHHLYRAALAPYFVKPTIEKMAPDFRKNSQDFIKEKYSLTAEKPINFVFHGGSGSSQEEIREAISYGAIKMNIDTDMQWAFWQGILDYYQANEAYLQGQIGNPDGDDKPNKKYYDPRVWLRKGEEEFVKRLTGAFEDLNCINANDKL